MGLAELMAVTSFYSLVIFDSLWMVGIPSSCRYTTERHADQGQEYDIQRSKEKFTISLATLRNFFTYIMLNIRCIWFEDEMRVKLPGMLINSR